MNTLIKNGMIVTEGSIMRADLYLRNEAIHAIGFFDEDIFDEVHDVSGMYVMPGAIDPHTHMELQQSPEFRSIDDFYSGTVAAAVGGTTMIIDHIAFGPKGCNLHYSIDQYHQLAKKSVIDYSFHGVIQEVNQEILKELDEIIRLEGIPSFKAYSTYGYAMSDEDFYLLLTQIKQSGGILTVHCENDEITNFLRRQFALQRKTSPIYHAKSRPNETEAEAVDCLINIAQMAGDAPLYIVHTSTKQALERIETARYQGQKNIFCETCPQYLLLTEDEYDKNGDEEGTKFLMAPPLRQDNDRIALWNGITSGQIDTVATDHCPFYYETQKKPFAKDFLKAPGGAPGVEERVRLIFSEGVQKGRMTLPQFVQTVSTNAAIIFGMYPQKGTLQPGADADIMVIDPNQRDILTVKNMKGNADYSPYEGMEVQCSIHKVFSRGKLVAVDNEFVGRQGDGKFIKRKIGEIWN